ncbi:MAG: alpha-glucan family phosphorylase [Cytophagales bacterium]|nr:alpha-glucan family phosphorylase [Cytophagales bacterium]
MISTKDIFNYKFDEQYKKPIAYFSMEFAIDQSLKTYSGGLGFLAGSHMRSAYELRQNLVGIGMLWKYGYYDQERTIDNTLKVSYTEKNYYFLHDTGIIFPISIHNADIYLKAYMLKPETFNTCPVFFLTTDIAENDHISQTITHRLYDSNEATRIAQSIVLGVGGAKLLDILERKTEIYHMNEGHALPLAFYLYQKYGNKIKDVKKHLVFTTHTPEKAGNEVHSVFLLNKMSFFGTVNIAEVKQITNYEYDHLDYTLTALRMAKVANAVSKMHKEVSDKMWKSYEGVCEIKAITNAQNKTYWKDEVLEQALSKDDDELLMRRKKELKKQLFKIIANQSGKLFDENILTLVWARRFAGYKRADLMMRDRKVFDALLRNDKMPIQIIWAGKPYPEDFGAIHIFNDLVWSAKPYANVAVLTGYELELSAYLKKGSDVWLNNPNLYREASGTSGMTAAMNASVNFSIADGWVPEFAKHGHNSFIIPYADRKLNQEEQNNLESKSLMNILQNEILPTYYKKPKEWCNIVKNAMREVAPTYDSNRMAHEYYVELYD